MSRTIRHSNRTPTVQPIEPLCKASPTVVAENQETPAELRLYRVEGEERLGRVDATCRQPLRRVVETFQPMWRCRSARFA